MAFQLVLFLHISSSWVTIRLYTENQLPRLSWSGLFFIYFCTAPHFFPSHISSTWVKLRLYTENQLPRLSWSGLKVPGGCWVGGWAYPLSSQAPTHVEAELGHRPESILRIKTRGIFTLKYEHFENLFSCSTLGSIS